MPWIPPRSNYGLIQEQLWNNPHRLLVACILLNLTTREQVDKVIWNVFERWPTAELLADADETELIEILKSLGMQNKRAKTLKRFSSEFLSSSWKTAKDLHGCGKYADDSYRIFCVGDWRSVSPNDHALKWYHDFLKETL